MEDINMTDDQKNTSLTIAQAITAVNLKRTFENSGTEERNILDKTYISLSKLSWKVASSEVKKFIAEISEGKDELRVIIKEIDESYKELSELKRNIQNVAKSIEKFVCVLELL
jgi:hypothetical protein